MTQQEIVEQILAAKDDPERPVALALKEAAKKCKK